MQGFISTHVENSGRQVVEALKKNGFLAEYLPDAAAARDRVLALIPDGASVGFGGSMTIASLNVKGELAKKGCTLYDHAGIKDPEEVLRIRRQELLCDVLLTSTNAITKDGRLYNVDGVGNRVAAMIFGPKEGILVAGVNKIVPDLAAAEKRVSHWAAPLNSLRVGGENPCTKTGACMDCTSPKRICNAAVTLHKCPSSITLRLLIVGETLGF